ncbi:hypothetical protein V6N13_123651 [Hibiscus sabdariffa]
MPELPEDSRLPKKQRCRVEAPLDITSTDIPATMDCDNPILAAPGMNPPSYKDMLTGGSVNDPDDDLISLDEDDIELLDEDVRIGEMDVIFVLVIREMRIISLIRFLKINPNRNSQSPLDPGCL